MRRARVPRDRAPAPVQGATAVEYGLIIALIAGVVIGVIVTLGTQVVALFNTMVGAF